MANTRKRLTKFYLEYQPLKMDNVGKLMSKIDGDAEQEHTLFRMLVKKYGEEPVSEDEEEEEASEEEQEAGGFEED